MQAVTSSPLRKNLKQAIPSRDESAPLNKSNISGLPFTLAQLRIVKAISISGSFKKAAESLYVSPPTVSSQIHNLEHQLGLRLFERCGQHNEITEAGLLVVDFAGQILKLCQESCRVIQDLHDLQNNTLFLGASHTPGTYLVPHLLGEFRQECPQIALQVNIESPFKICLDMVNDLYDLAMIEGEIPSELQPSLEVLATTEDELVLVVSRVHPLAQREQVPADVLEQFEFIALESQPFANVLIKSGLERQDVDLDRLNVVMRLTSLETVKNAVQANLGAAFVPRSAIEKEVQLGLLHHIKIKDLTLKQKIFVVTKAGQNLPNPAQTFVQRVISKFSHLKSYETEMLICLD